MDNLPELLARVEGAGLGADLPPHFEWGPDAMEHFRFGKERAVAAILRALQSPDQSAAAEIEALITEHGADMENLAGNFSRALGASDALLREAVELLRPFAAAQFPGYFTHLPDQRELHVKAFNSANAMEHVAVSIGHFRKARAFVARLLPDQSADPVGDAAQTITDPREGLNTTEEGRG